MIYLFILLILFFMSIFVYYVYLSNNNSNNTDIDKNNQENIIDYTDLIDFDFIELSNSKEFIVNFIKLFNKTPFKDNIINKILDMLSKYMYVDKLKIDTTGLVNFFDSIKLNGIDIYNLLGEELIIKIFADNMPNEFSILKFDNIYKIKLSLYLSYLANKYDLYEYYNFPEDKVDKINDTLIKHFVKIKTLLLYNDDEFYKEIQHNYLLSSFIKYNEHKRNTFYLLIKNSELYNFCNVIDVDTKDGVLNKILIKYDNDIKDIFINIINTYICDSLIDESLTPIEINKKLQKHGINVEKLIDINVHNYNKKFISMALQDVKIISTDFPVYSLFVDKKILDNALKYIYNYYSKVKYEYFINIFIDFLHSNYITNNNIVFFIRENKN